jgi:hypothetical protein
MYPTDKPIREQYPELWSLTESLVNREKVGEQGFEALRKLFPHAPEEMVRSGAHHAFVDGIDATLRWLAMLEEFLRDPINNGLCSGWTGDMLYHVYNFWLFQELIPDSRADLLKFVDEAIELLTDEKEGPESALETMRTLREILTTNVSPPYIESADATDYEPGSD